MKFNPTPLECVLFIFVCLAIYIWTKHGRRITRWIECCGHHSERLHERLFHCALSIGHLQLDELVTKVKRDVERIWVWTAVAAQSKLILTLHIGRLSDRSKELGVMTLRIQLGVMPRLQTNSIELR